MSEAAPPESTPPSGPPPSLAKAETPRTSAPRVEEAAPSVNPIIYHAMMQAMRLPLILAGQRTAVYGREHVPPPGTPLVVAANHESSLDPFMVARALPPGRMIQFMAKKELFRPVVGWIIRTGGTFPVDRESNDLRAIRAALRILKNNGTIGIFPEGHRGGTELQGGVALIAAKGRAPILPVGIHREGRVWVLRFGPVIPSTGGLKAVTAELGARIAELEQPIGARGNTQ